MNPAIEARTRAARAALEKLTPLTPEHLALREAEVRRARHASTWLKALALAIIFYWTLPDRAMDASVPPALFGLLIFIVAIGVDAAADHRTHWPMRGDHLSSQLTLARIAVPAVERFLQSVKAQERELTMEEAQALLSAANELVLANLEERSAMPETST